MSLKNFLDLRKKTQPQVKIIERIILQKRSIKSDIFLALSVILVATGVIWSVSKADSLNPFTKPQVKNFSASGIVLNIDEANLYIDQAKGSDDVGRTTYVFSLLNNPKIETVEYQQLSISDIQVGSKVVAQGKIDGGNITIKRIIYFGIIEPKELTATTTPANLPGEDLKGQAATTTIEESATTVGTSTESNSKTNIIDVVKDTVIDIIDSVSKDNSSTTENSNIENSSTTNQSNTEESTSTTTADTLIEKISDTIDSAGSVVKNTIDKIVEIVVGTSTGTSSLDNLPLPETSSTTENI